MILCLYSLAYDLFVLTLELMMRLKDIEEFEVVLALYTITHCMDGMIDEIAEDDLPDSLCSDYRAVRSSISSLVKSIEQYRDENIATVVSDCED